VTPVPDGIVVVYDLADVERVASTEAGWSQRSIDEAREARRSGLVYGVQVLRNGAPGLSIFAADEAHLFEGLSFLASRFDGETHAWFVLVGERSLYERIACTLKTSPPSTVALS
jgi:hypothetical protein